MDDFGLDSGSYGDFFGGDSFGGDSFGGCDLMSQFQPDILSGGGMYSPGSMADPFATFNAGQMADPSASIASGSGGGFFSGLFGGGSAGPGAGSGGAGGVGGGSMLPGLLGLGGGLASMVGTIAGGGMGPKPQMSVPQKAALNQAYGANQQLGQFAQGQTPLQQMQMSLLQALQSGQGLPPGYQQLIEQAYQPQMGRLYDQAVNAGRARGFYDSPATAPPGGAILGPGLADLQGQMAASKLGLMQSLPGMFQAPIQQQQAAAQGQAGGFTNLGGQYPVQQQQNIAPQLGQQFGAGLQGLGQSIGQNQQQAQQQQFQNSLLKAMQQGNSGLSYQAPQYG